MVSDSELTTRGEQRQLGLEAQLGGNPLRANGRGVEFNATQGLRRRMGQHFSQTPFGPFTFSARIRRTSREKVHLLEEDEAENIQREML